MPKNNAEIFAAAAPLYDFTSPTLKPWHMKVNYQLYNQDGKPSDQGTFEYWWAAPDTYSSSWTRPGLSNTDWHVKGQHSHLRSGESLTFFERKLQSDLLHPLPKSEDLDPEKVRFEREEQKFGSVKLPCVMVVRKMLMKEDVREVPFGEFPTFCFNPDHPMLRAYYAFGATSVIYNRIVRWQGLYLPREVTIQQGSRQLLTASVDVIESIASDAPQLVPSKDAEADLDRPHATVSSAVAQGFLLKSVPPYYPVEAKFDHIQGKVVLQAVIGTDGHVHELSVVEAPSPLLIGSAIRAVSQWVYKPYLLNGSPVEVETTINVIFYLGK